MLLYHFTTLYALKDAGADAILAAGLKPGPIGFKELGLPKRNVVWLTADPDTVFFLTPPEVRVTVDIPKTDRRLFKWQQLLGDHCDPGMVAMVEADAAATFNHDVAVTWRQWWVYYGQVRLHRIRAIEVCPPRQTTLRRTDAARGASRPVTGRKRRRKQHATKVAR